MSGTNRVDEAAAATTLGEALARPGGAEVRTLTGFAIGGIPPFGHDQAIATYMDADLLRYDVVWAAAGTWHDVFPLSPADLERVSGGTVVDLKRS